MRPWNPRIALLLLAAVLASGGCSNPTAPKSLGFGASDSVFTDAQMRNALDSPTYTSPFGFYSEALPANYATPIYVSSVTLAACGPRPIQWVEYSTEDTAQARLWALQTLACASVASGVSPLPPLVTQRYIQYVSDQVGQAPRQPVRVHRASYLDRYDVDLFHPGSLIGVLKARPVNADAARGVAEYFWYLDHPNYWMNGTKVLTSFSRPSTGSVLHTIYFVHRTTAWGLLGAVTVVELGRDDFRIDAATGAITLSETVVRDISS